MNSSISWYKGVVTIVIFENANKSKYEDCGSVTGQTDDVRK